MEGAKKQAGTAKDKADVLVDKAGEKMPDKVKDTYAKVSEKAEKIIPGERKKDDAGDAVADASDAVGDAATSAADNVQDAAGDVATSAADKAEDTTGN